MNNENILVNGLYSIECNSGSIYTLNEGNEEHLFYSGSHEKTIVQWDLTNPNQNKAIAKFNDKVFAIELIKQKGLLLVGNFSGGIHVIDLTKKQEVKLLQLHPSIVFDIKYLKHKNCFYALAFDGSFSVWDLESFQLIYSKKLGNFKLRNIQFNLETNVALIGCGDGLVRIFNLDTHEHLQSLEGHMKDFSVNTLKFTPNKSLLFTGSRDGHLNVWDAKNEYNLIQKIPAHNYAIYDIAFSPDGKYFATCSMDKTVKIWDTETIEVLKRIDSKTGGHTNSVNKLYWSNYNNLLVSTGDDRTIKVWEIATA